MRVFKLDPLGFILALHNADFVVGSATLALSQNADINLVGENALDSFVSPFCGISGFEDSIELNTDGMLVFHWRQDTHLIQTFRNPFRCAGAAGRMKTEKEPHDGEV